MTGMFALAMIIALCTGYFAVSLIDRELELRFRLLFSIPMGFGITSIFYFLYLCFNINNLKEFIIFELIAAIVLSLLYYNQERPDMSKHKFIKLNSWFYLVNVYAICIFTKFFITNPMGSWDGFRIWNIKAEFLFLDNPLWKNVFSLPHFMSHCDYPLFLPAATARLWQYSGGQDFSANIIFAMFFTFGLVYLLYQALQYFKSEKIAIVVCSVFMISDIFLVNGASQCADIPLAFFFLSAIVCMFLYFKNQRYGSLALGIIFAALSVWVKNEGLMFFLIYMTTILGWFLYSKKFKASAVIALCFVPVLAAYAYYKKFTNAPNDLIAGFMVLKSYSFAFDVNRYLVTLKTFISFTLHKFTLFLALSLLALKGFRIKDKIKTPFILSSIIFVLMLLGYLTVYIVAPHDIKWLVENSMDRIILQILPIFLFLFSICLRIGKPDTTN